MTGVLVSDSSTVLGIDTAHDALLEPIPSRPLSRGLYSKCETLAAAALALDILKHGQAVDTLLGYLERDSEAVCNSINCRIGFMFGLLAGERAESTATVSRDKARAEAAGFNAHRHREALSGVTRRFAVCHVCGQRLASLATIKHPREDCISNPRCREYGHSTHLLNRLWH